MQEAVVELYEKQQSIQRAVLESVSGHTETIISTITTNGTGFHETLQIESRRAEFRHHEQFSAVVANQEALHGATQHSLEQLSANSRENNEATRRALEQSKAVMAKIGADIAQRDKELKALLVEISQTRNIAQRENSMEKSNPVTVALCALVTVYENSQVAEYPALL